MRFQPISVALGQPAQDAQDAQQPRATDAEYRKFDDLVSFLRARNAKQYAITSPKGIDEAQFVTIGGIEQWVTIHGWDRDNPVLLFRHGGPGDVTNPWTFALFAPWEKQFTRGAMGSARRGQNAAKNRPRSRADHHSG